MGRCWKQKGENPVVDVESQFDGALLQTEG